MIVQEINAKPLPSRWGLASKPCNSDLQFSGETPATNRHARLWMCEVCEQYPASVTCKADSAALCSSCDHDIHSVNHLAGRHYRVPVVPFLDCVSATKSSACSAFIVPDDDILPPLSTATSGFILDPFSDFGYTENFVSLKQEVPDGQIYGADSVVPTQTTNNNNLNGYGRDNCFPVDFSAHCIGQRVSSSELVVPDGNSIWTSDEPNNLPSAQPLPLSGMDRAARVMRYREKKKNRNFEKTIRYASRKAYAEMRPRIKGRFVKRIGSDGNADCEVDLMYTSGIQEFTADHGVVPLL